LLFEGTGKAVRGKQLRGVSSLVSVHKANRQ
jgi:hypothetical protein